MKKAFDFVIVGGGTAGCVLANRLSENPIINVLLIEAGGNDNSPWIHFPIGFAKMTSGPFTWGLKTVPQKYALNREISYTQAKVIGGGSSVNAEVFTRGNPADYDRWAHEEGCVGWSFEDVKPYFVRSEGNCVYSGDWHGTNGPLGVSNIHSPMPITWSFVKACQENGIPYNPDFNGPIQEGAGPYQLTVLNNRRCSAAKGYLKPVMDRQNLTVLTKTQVLRILFDKNRAVGVEYRKGGNVERALAQSEVLITSGAINTPKLLMLSGIGPASHLKQHNIEVVQDLPGVGENLNDHFGVDIVAELNGPYSLDHYDGPWGMFKAGLQYLLFNSGPVTSNIVEGGCFWYSDQSSPVPDLQFHFLAGAGKEEGVPSIPSGSGITLNSYTLRPKSRGTVRLVSDNPGDNPLVDPNYLCHPYDQETSGKGVMISTEIFNQPSLQKYIKKIHYPNDEVKTHEDFVNYARQYGRTSYHPTCTCKMGTDEMSVVDPQLKAYGIDGLRICDSSIMPSLIGSNTNAPTVMIAEKASDMIRMNY
ncbi:MAG: GMC family oxidoreductase N-terminal domain-containing protein [Paracoccaceae bacterium]|nr:GMC family oxidoreductase N-terminal domain-containing protein [Paracoccaceae bacterium]MDE2674361.1 GMC family oxidoreductase N-terminal domain-containing protein [Paracoccaceae bacterium]